MKLTRPSSGSNRPLVKAPGGGPGGIFLATLAMAFVLVGAGTAEAGPARYIFEQCDSALPGGGTQGVFLAQHPRFSFGAENTCAQRGGALILRQPAMPANDGGAASWGVPATAPAGSHFDSVTITAASCAGPPSSAYAFAEGWPPPYCGEDTRTFPLAEKFKTGEYKYDGFSIGLSCVSASGCGSGPWVFAHYLATIVVDPVAPVLGEPGGSLFDPGTRRGGQNLVADAQDLGGGVSAIWPTVNGVQAASPTSAGCAVAHAENASVYGEVAAEVSPCPAQLGGEWSLDTGRYPFRDGANTVAVCASDFATLDDPNSACTTPRTVQIDNSCLEAGVGGGAALSAEFRRSHAEQTTVGHGKGAEVIGELNDIAGEPIPGAALCIKSAPIGLDRAPEVIGVAKTDASGHYTYPVSPGPSRELLIGYRHDTTQVARKVRYYARARAWLRVNDSEVENGDRVRFAGRLAGPAAGGRVVVLQAGALGSSRWFTFRRTTTGRKGAFRAGYRFSSTSRRTTYRFRVVVPRQAGYPWVEGHSKPVEVVVRPG